MEGGLPIDEGGGASPPHIDQPWGGDDDDDQIGQKTHFEEIFLDFILQNEIIVPDIHDSRSHQR